MSGNEFVQDNFLWTARVFCGYTHLGENYDFNDRQL